MFVLFCQGDNITIPLTRLCSESSPKISPLYLESPEQKPLMVLTLKSSAHNAGSAQQQETFGESENNQQGRRER
jgi:hypothetical protein